MREGRLEQALSSRLGDHFRDGAPERSLRMFARPAFQAGLRALCDEALGRGART